MQFSNAQDELQVGRQLDPQVGHRLRHLPRPMEHRGPRETGSLALLPQVVEVRSSSIGRAIDAITAGLTITPAMIALGLKG